MTRHLFFLAAPLEGDVCLKLGQKGKVQYLNQQINSTRMLHIYSLNDLLLMYNYNYIPAYIFLSNVSSTFASVSIAHSNDVRGFDC